MFVDPVGKGIQTGPSGDPGLCSVMSGPQLGRPEGWDDSAAGCTNNLEVPSLISFFGARIT